MVYGRENQKLLEAGTPERGFPGFSGQGHPPRVDQGILVRSRRGVFRRSSKGSGDWLILLACAWVVSAAVLVGSVAYGSHAGWDARLPGKSFLLTAAEGAVIGSLLVVFAGWLSWLRARDHQPRDAPSPKVEEQA